MRLQRYLALSGVASRRASEELIKAGRVTVNGTVQTEMGLDVNEQDTVLFDGRKVEPIEEHEYWAFYKPGGIVSSVKDPEGRKTVMAFYKGKQRVYPVGRLDYDSEGLMILTTDGDYANRLMHPKFEKEKEYEVELDRPLTPADLETLSKDTVIDGYRLQPVDIRQAEGIYYFTLKEGRNRQIRKMTETLGYEVKKLKRVRMGKVRLGSLRPGQMRPLTKDEIL